MTPLVSSTAASTIHPDPVAAQDASVSTPAAKSKPRTCREFERAMRELGFSQREATAIASHGFKGLAQESAIEDVSELAALIQRNNQLFERYLERNLP